MEHSLFFGVRARRIKYSECSFRQESTIRVHDFPGQTAPRKPSLIISPTDLIQKQSLPIPAVAHHQSLNLHARILWKLPNFEISINIARLFDHCFAR